MRSAEVPRIKLESVERFERDVRLRLPFRFGVTTVTEATQAVIRARISLDGRLATGVAAESLAAKWFDKSLALSDEQNIEQLRQSLDIAVELYRAHGADTGFGLFARTYHEQHRRAAALGLNPLIASYGPALIDRAVIDALGRALGLSFGALMARNLVGVGAALTPDLAGFDLDGFLGGLRLGRDIAVRHTVGLVDPITAADQEERVDDGLPETLEEVVRHYGCRYYKLKVGGDVAADLDRLARIASVLDRAAGDYRATLDGNEQYEDVEGIAELWRRMREAPALNRLCDSILFIEQPIRRAVALSRPVAALAERPLIIDESDGALASFPDAVALGYRGVSSKICKGFYKSVLNAARVARLNAAAGGPRYFMSAEDLTTWAGVSVQQDLALASLLGLEHVERNGHHFIDGMSFAPEAEQNAFVAAHPDLYQKRTGAPARLRIRDGRLRIGSLDGPGFAVGAEMDFGAMREMPAAPTGPIRARATA